MRRKAAILLVVISVCALTLTACRSGETETAETETGTQEEAETDAEETEASDQSQDDLAIYADAGEDESEDEGEIKRSDTEFTEATMPETELYNAGGITVTATGFDADAEYGPEISVEVVNDSDQTVQIGAEDVSVNGYMMDTGLLYIVASPGNTVDDVITLYDFDLDARGIDTVATVSLSIAVMDFDTYEEIGTGERITLTTSASEGFTQEVNAEGEVIYDKDGVLVINQGLQQDDVWDGDLVLYMENDTDTYIGVTTNNVSINGVDTGGDEQEVSLWADLYPDTRAVAGMYLLDLEEPQINNLNEVKEISFELQIIDQEAWEELDTSERITLEFH